MIHVYIGMNFSSLNTGTVAGSFQVHKSKALISTYFSFGIVVGEHRS